MFLNTLLSSHFYLQLILQCLYLIAQLRTFGENTQEEIYCPPYFALLGEPNKQIHVFKEISQNNLTKLVIFTCSSSHNKSKSSSQDDDKSQQKNEDREKHDGLDFPLKQLRFTSTTEAWGSGKLGQLSRVGSLFLCYVCTTHLISSLNFAFF